MTGEGQIKIATITTNNLEAMVAAYTRYLDQDIIEEGVIDGALARSWGAPKVTDAPYTLLGPKSGMDCYIRLIERPSFHPVKPLGSLGWSALEITVQDADALYEAIKEDSPFSIIGPPQYLEFGEAFYPMQAAGPMGEVLYLNKVNSNTDLHDLPKARSFVDHLFITVVATKNLDDTMAFYAHSLGWDKGPGFDVCVPVLNPPLGVPDDYKLKLGMTGIGRMPNVEIDEFPPHIGPRNTDQDDLPPGIAMVSFMAENIEKPGLVPLGPSTQPLGKAYGGCKSLTYKGTAGELIELIEVG